MTPVVSYLRGRSLKVEALINENILVFDVLLIDVVPFLKSSAYNNNIYPPSISAVVLQVNVFVVYLYTSEGFCNINFTIEYVLMLF